MLGASAVLAPSDPDDAGAFGLRGPLSAVVLLAALLLAAALVPARAVPNARAAAVLAERRSALVATGGAVLLLALAAYLLTGH